MVLRKQRESSDVLIVDASRHFVKEGKNNKLRACDIKRIVDAYKERPEKIEKFARRVSRAEIIQNDYNLNIPRYVDTFEEEELVDIDEVKRNIESIEAELSQVQAQMAKYMKELGL